MGNGDYFCIGVFLQRAQFVLYPCKYSYKDCCLCRNPLHSPGFLCQACQKPKPSAKDPAKCFAKITY